MKSKTNIISDNITKVAILCLILCSLFLLPDHKVQALACGQGDCVITACDGGLACQKAPTWFNSYCMLPTNIIGCTSTGATFPTSWSACCDPFYADPTPTPTPPLGATFTPTPTTAPATNCWSTDGVNCDSSCVYNTSQSGIWKTSCSKAASSCSCWAWHDPSNGIYIWGTPYAQVDKKYTGMSCTGSSYYDGNFDYGGWYKCDSTMPGAVGYKLSGGEAKVVVTTRSKQPHTFAGTCTNTTDTMVSQHDTISTYVCENDYGCKNLALSGSATFYTFSGACSASGSGSCYKTQGATSNGWNYGDSNMCIAFDHNSNVSANCSDYVDTGYQTPPLTCTWLGSPGSTPIPTPTLIPCGSMTSCTSDSQCAGNYCDPSGHCNTPGCPVSVIIPFVCPGACGSTPTPTPVSGGGTIFTAPVILYYGDYPWMKLVNTDLVRRNGATTAIYSIPYIADKYAQVVPAAGVGNGDLEDPGNPFIIDGTSPGIVAGSSTMTTTRPQSHSVSGGVITNYTSSFIASSLSTYVGDLLRLKPLTEMPGTTLTPGTIYTKTTTGAYALPAITIPLSDKGTILVVKDAANRIMDVSITANLTNTSTLVIIGNNITIDPTVTQVNAILIAQGQVIIQNPPSGTVEPLKITGNIVAYGGITQNRSRSDRDHARPSVLMVFSPKMYMDSLRLLSTNDVEYKTE